MDYSLVLETANLNFAEKEGLWTCLDSIRCAIKKANPPRETLLYAGGEITRDMLAAVQERYPWVTIVQAEAGMSYYGMKMAGARRASADIVVLADSDCTYEEDWLTGLLQPFENPAINIVAGETTFTKPGPHSLALAIAFAFDGYSDMDRLYPINYYCANNVACRRELLVESPIPLDLPLYRSGCFRHCVELRKRGETIWAQPRSRTRHATFAGFSFFFWRFLLLGRDRSVRRRLGLQDDAPRVRAYDQGRNFLWRRFGRAVQSQPEQRKWLPLALLIALAARGLVRIGGMVAKFRPDAFIQHFSKQEGVYYPTVEEYLSRQPAVTEGHTK